jgi:sugar lactone lactonase YvrE
MPLPVRPSGLLHVFLLCLLCLQLAGCAGIQTQPQSQTVLAGQTASFSVVGQSSVSGATLTYQWYRNGAAIAGATTASYSFTAKASDNGASFYVIVSDGSTTTATSNTVTLTITPVLASVAGGIGGPGSYDGSASIARFMAPYAVAADSAGNLYVADTANNTIRKISSSGQVTTLAGKAGQIGATDGTGSAALFFQPQGLAVDGAGNVYVADTNNETIRKITPAGVVTTLAGGAGLGGNTDGTGTAARFNSPWGIAVDAAGTLYVVDHSGCTIRKVTAAGVVTTLAGAGSQNGLVDGAGAAARFSNPEGIALDGAGNLLVVDTYNAALRRVTPAGVVSTVVQGHFAQPLGVAVNAQGTIFVSDSASQTISTVSAAGVVSPYTGQAGMLGTTNGSLAAATFFSPAGMAVDSSGNLYIADSGDSLSTSRQGYGVPGGVDLFAEYQGSAIRKITPAGQVSTLAGSGQLTGALDGSASAARFFGPYGLAGDAAGNLFVADSHNNTVRKLTAAGVTSTLAGTAGFYGEADGSGAAAGFTTPTGMASDSSGNVYVADSGQGVVRKVTAAGVVSTLAGQGKGGVTLSQPTGIAVDSSSNVYVADTMNNCIRKIVPAGTVSTFAGTCSTAPGTLNQPSALAVDTAGNVYVADAGSSTIEKISSAGAVSTLAGAGSRGAVDGTGTAATFSAPQGLAVDSAGNVYVADTLNSTVRKITSAGVVTTVVGQAGVAAFVPGVSTVNLLAYPKQLAIAGSALYITMDNAVVSVTPLP